MVLGKRTRHSLASSTPSLAASTSSSTSSICSSPASSVPPSPTSSSFKRIRTRSSEPGDFCNKENEAPANWFVCGRRAADEEGGDDADAAAEAAEEREPSRQPSAREMRAQRRVVSTSSTARPRSRLPVSTLLTPPITPSHRKADATRSGTLTRATPSLRLSQLSLATSADSTEVDMEVDSPSTPPATPAVSKYARARTLLRCGTRVDDPGHSVIAAREAERGTIEAFITDNGFLSTSPAETPAISSLYISGSPGTGKTAVVLDVVQKLQNRHSLSQLGDHISPTAVCVNCTGLGNVQGIWARVWEELHPTLGGSVSKGKAGDARKNIEKALTQQQDLRCILVLDELDAVSKVPTTLAGIYQLASRHPQRLRLIGISNTLTLGSSASPTLPSTSSAPSGPQKTLNFQAYTSDDLLVILRARLQSLDEKDRTEIINPAALTFLCKKAAAQNGDVRFALSVLRRCLDSVEKASKTGQPGRVEMKHVLESLRVESRGGASGPSPLASQGSSASVGSVASGSKGSGVSCMVRNLSIQARLAIVALMVGWKRVEAGLPLTGSIPAAVFTSPSKPARSPTKRTSSSPSHAFSASSSHDSITPSSLHSFYYHILTSRTVTSDGMQERLCSFDPVSLAEFQDVLGLLESEGLLAHSATPPSTFAATASQSTSSLPTSSATKGVFKTPSKPKRAFSTPSVLSTPSRSGGRRGAKASGEQYVILPEGVREDEIVRGLSSSTTVVAGDAKAGALEKEVMALWNRECAKIVKDLKTIDRRRAEETEKQRQHRDAFEDDPEDGN